MKTKNDKKIFTSRRGEDFIITGFSKPVIISKEIVSILSKDWIETIQRQVRFGFTTTAPVVDENTLWAALSTGFNWMKDRYLKVSVVETAGKLVVSEGNTHRFRMLSGGGDSSWGRWKSHIEASSILQEAIPQSRGGGYWVEMSILIN